MKKFLFVLFVASFTCGVSLFAHQSEVELMDVHDKDLSMGHDNKTPIVSCEGEDIVIKCDTTISNVGIVIRDQYGLVLYQSITSLGPTEMQLVVPNVGNGSEKTTIDLYYDKKHLVGFFK